MSGLGLLATALAGGAGVIGKQAGDDIEAGRKADLMRQQADIEEQMRMRIMERQEDVRQRGALADVTGPLGKAKLDYKSRELAAQSDAEIAKARGLIPVQQEAATAANETATGLAKKNAADPTYLKSISVLKLADPEVRAHIAQMGAAAGASAASAKESAERLRQLGEVGTMATQVRGLQTKLAGAKTDEERSAIQQQITDLGFSGKDTKGFLSIAERAITNGDAALKVLNNPDADPAAKDAARTQLERANEFAEKAAAQAGIKINGPAKPSQQQAHAEAEAAIKQGVSREAINERLTKLGYQPLGGATKPGMVPGAERAVSAKPEPVYRKADSGRIVDVTTGRTLTPEQSAIYEKMQRGEPTTPRERELLKD